MDYFPKWFLSRQYYIMLFLFSEYLKTLMQVKFTNLLIFNISDMHFKQTTVLNWPRIVYCLQWLLISRDFCRKWWYSTCEFKVGSLFPSDLDLLHIFNNLSTCTSAILPHCLSDKLEQSGARGKKNFLRRVTVTVLDIL